MPRTILLSVLSALVLATSFASAPARAEVSEPAEAYFALARAGRYGPFATLRRANEVANYYRGRGYNARVVYLGTLEFRSYAVDVW